MSEMKDSHVNVVVSIKYNAVKYHSSKRIIIIEITVTVNSAFEDNYCLQKHC